MAQFSLEQGTQVLERTPRVLRAWLTGLDAMWLRGDYGAGTFHPLEIVGHLIHGDRTDWMVRVQTILAHGSEQPFAPFDRYAQFEECRGKGLEELLTEFETVRSENLTQLRKLNPGEPDMRRSGWHPALGAVTLGQLLATWVAHDLNHLAQVAKAMAHQYESAVGPWREYLGILKSPTTRMDEEGLRRQQAARGQAHTS